MFHVKQGGNFMIEEKNTYLDTFKEINKRPDFLFFIFFGERSAGKTFSSLLGAIKDSFETRRPFVYLRRKRDELMQTSLNTTLSAFTGFNPDMPPEKTIFYITNGQYDRITYYNRVFYFSNYDIEHNKIIRGEIAGYAFALQNCYNDKGIDIGIAPNYIIFDEFISITDYLYNEISAYYNTLSTILREKSGTKIIFLGNSVNYFNPYFAEFGITDTVRTMKRGEIRQYSFPTQEKDVKLMVYYTDAAPKKNSNIYFCFGKTKPKMITDGDWDLRLYPHLDCDFNKENILDIYFIEWDNRIYQAEIIKTDNNLFTYIHQKTTPLKNDDDFVFSTIHSSKYNYFRNIKTISNKLIKFYYSFFVNDKVFYQNNLVGNDIENYLNWCKQN